MSSLSLMMSTGWDTWPKSMLCSTPPGSGPRPGGGIKVPRRRPQLSRRSLEARRRQPRAPVRLAVVAVAMNVVAVADDVDRLGYLAKKHALLDSPGHRTSAGWGYQGTAASTLHLSQENKSQTVGVEGGARHKN